MNCTFHPDRPTLLRCTRCGRPACPDCLRDAPVGAHCVACLRGVPVDQPLTDAAARRLAGSARPAAAGGARRRPGWFFYALVAAFAAACVAGYLMPLASADLRQPPVAAKAVALAIVILGTLLAVTLHEWAHAFVAYRGGDTSVATKGYLTLDFRRYSDPLLSIGMPVLFLLLGALPLPGGAVWINHGALRSRWWRTGMSLAGSSMNLLVGVVAALVVGSGVLAGHPVLAGSLAYLALIMFGVAILNLLPIPGLDGYAALEPHLPREIRRTMDAVRPFGLWVVLALMIFGFFGFIWDAASAMTDALGVDPRWIGVGAILASVRAF